MSNELFICKICNKEYKNVQALSKHITEKHKIDKKEYYDTYLKKENEGICKYCGNTTMFIGLGGYNSNCSNCTTAFHNSDVWKNNVQKTMLKRFGFICMIEHKVKIITDCSKYITYIEQKYGKHFLEGCKND